MRTVRFARARGRRVDGRRQARNALVGRPSGLCARSTRVGPLSESANQNHIRRVLAERGVHLDRNNRGVLLDKRGVPVRFGLANDSEQLGRVLKSGDLIGWRQLLVTPEMVGSSVAQYASIEVKPHGWKPPGVGPVESGGKLTAYGHYLGQKRWADLVNAEGGWAGFMIDPERGFE